MFKALITALLLAVPSAAAAGEIGELLKWAGEQRLKAGTIILLSGDIQGAGYWTGPQFGQGGFGIGKPDAKSYIDFNVGIAGPKEGNVEAIIAPLFHPANLSQAIWRRLPFRERLKIPKLPDIEAGPIIKIPTDKLRSWRWDSHAGFMVGVKLEF